MKLVKVGRIASPLLTEGDSEAIAPMLGLVPINALVLTTVRLVGKPHLTLVEGFP